jgi:hypothetical protein
MTWRAYQGGLSPEEDHGKFFSRFYSYPLLDCQYPWILRNIKQKPQQHAKHEIVDIGIYDLLKPPYTHSDEKLIQWEKLKTDGWKVVPDCPDLKGEFNVDGAPYDNTEYSFKLLKRYYNPEDKSHLPVIQSKFQDIDSLNEYIINFKEYYNSISERKYPEKIAIGSICKIRHHTTGVRMLKVIRDEFPKSWIHAFGLNMVQFKMGGKNYINSFDSMSWTFPRAHGELIKTRGRGPCKNNKERNEFFDAYILRLEELYNLK